MQKKKNNKKSQIKKSKKNNSKENVRDFKSKNNKRKKGVFGKILKAFIIIALLVGGCAFALTSPIFNIESIKVSGNEKIKDTTYIKLSELKVNNNIFKFRKSDSISKIKKNSYVDDVKIKRVLPNKIEIIIKERKTKFLIKQEDKYVYIDEKGNILEISDEKKELAIIEGISTESKNLKAGKMLNEDDIEKIGDIIKIQNSIQNKELKQFDSINIKNKYDYILIYEKEAKKVYLGDTSNLDTKILYMKYILDENEGIPGSIYLNQSKVYFSPE